jgi:putative hydrolase of the HAD superfamily
VIIVFDLDEVLYDEKTYVISGFRAVSEFLEKDEAIPKKIIFEYLKRRLKNGRERIFNDLLDNFRIYSQKNLKKCISVYRTHTPKIKLYSDAKDCLKRLKNYPLYIVTDGNKMVQKNKIKALNLENHVKKTILTSNYGLRNSKPSTFCFQKICDMEKTSPTNLVYIGDDPHKDFVGLKREGFKTIRLFKGRFKNERLSKEFEADYKIKSLKEINEKFIKKISAN